MADNMEQAILERMEKPGWVATRGLVSDPTAENLEEEYREAERAMRELAEKGKVTLWRLKVTHEQIEFLAAVRPGFDLDKELETRGAWATATRCECGEQ
jgi:hypothetical protein